MGCVLGGGGGMRRTVSRQAMHELNTAKARDEARCAPVFEALGIQKNKKLKDTILSAYSDCVSGGRGSVKQMFHAFDVDKNSRQYMRRTFTCLDPRNDKNFTSPQFALCLWNYVTVNMRVPQRRGPPIMAAEWTGRCFFGGDRCSPDFAASKDAVFELMDATMGLSAKYDYRPKSENNKDMKVFVGNSKEYDVKKAKALLQKEMGRAKTVDLKSFVRLAAKLQGILRFDGGAHHIITRKLKGGEGRWKKAALARTSTGEFDKIVEQLERDHPGLLRAPSKYASD